MCMFMRTERERIFMPAHAGAPRLSPAPEDSPLSFSLWVNYPSPVHWVHRARR